MDQKINNELKEYSYDDLRCLPTSERIIYLNKWYEYLKKSKKQDFREITNKEIKIRRRLDLEFRDRLREYCRKSLLNKKNNNPSIEYIYECIYCKKEFITKNPPNKNLRKKYCKRKCGEQYRYFKSKNKTILSDNT